VQITEESTDARLNLSKFTSEMSSESPPAPSHDQDFESRKKLCQLTADELKTLSKDDKKKYKDRKKRIISDQV
jgi:hypothetical protein